MTKIEHEEHVYQLTATANELVSYVGARNRMFADMLSVHVLELRSLLSSTEGESP